VKGKRERRDADGKNDQGDGNQPRCCAQLRMIREDETSTERFVALVAWVHGEIKIVVAVVGGKIC